MAQGHGKFFALLLAVIVIIGAIVWKLSEQNAQIVVSTTSRPLVATTAADIPITANEPLLGNPGAPLTLVAFIDLSDSASIDLYRTVVTFVLAHPKDARLVWKDLPSKHLFGKNATLAHQNAWCAGAQNHFWDFVAQILNSKSNLAQPSLTAAAAAIGMDTTKLSTCLASPEPASAIAASADLATRLGFRSAPTLFVNNKQVDLTQRIDLAALLNSLIAP
jgi:protein-disulfide isomerase